MEVDYHTLEMNVRSQIQKLSSITAADTSSGLRHLFNKKIFLQTKVMTCWILHT